MKTSLECVIFYAWVSGVNLLLNVEIEAVITEEETTLTTQDYQAPINLQSLSLEEKKKFQESFDTIISDCDGVLYNPEGVLHDAHRAVDELTKRNKSIYYVTNDSTLTKVQLLDNFKRLGFPNITADSIVSPIGLLVDYLRANLPAGKAVYVVGPSVACDELREHNIECFGPGRDEMTDSVLVNIASAEIEIRPDVGAVVVGFDLHFNYLKLTKAFKYLQNRDCLFVATNTDETYSTGRGKVLPDVGVMVAAIRVASGREPFVLGKPSTHLVDVLKSLGAPERTLFVGDRLNTDILMGRKCSFRTVLVLTGVHGLDDVARYAKSEKAEERMSVPHYYTNAFSDLVFG